MPELASLMALAWEPVSRSGSPLAESSLALPLRSRSWLVILLAPSSRWALLWVSAWISALASLLGLRLRSEEALAPAWQSEPELAPQLERSLQPAP